MRKLTLLICLLIGVAACGQQRAVAAVQPRAVKPTAPPSSSDALSAAEVGESNERHAVLSESNTMSADFRLTARVVDSAGQALEGAAWSLTRRGQLGRNHMQIASGVTDPTGTIETPMLTQTGKLSVRHPGSCLAVVAAHRTPLSLITELGEIELAQGGTVLVTLPPEFDVDAAHGWGAGAIPLGAVPLGAGSRVREPVDFGTLTARLEGLPAGKARVSARLADGTLTFLADIESVEVVAGQTTEIQLRAGRCWGCAQGVLELGPSWASLASNMGELDVESVWIHDTWGQPLGYKYKPTYRLFRRGELVSEVDCLWDVEPLGDLVGPFELEIEHETMEPFRSEPFSAISHVVAVVRGHCSLRFVVTSAATGQRLTGASVLISRVWAEFDQQLHTLGSKATIDGLPPEKFIVHVDAPGHARCTVTIPELANHEQREVRVELLPAMGARGSIVYEGRAAPAVPVSLQARQEGEWRRAASAWTDIAGNFQIEANTPGKYRVIVSHGSRPISAEFEVTPGEFVDVGTIVLESLTTPASH